MAASTTHSLLSHDADADPEAGRTGFVAMNVEAGEALPPESRCDRHFPCCRALCCSKDKDIDDLVFHHEKARLLDIVDGEPGRWVWLMSVFMVLYKRPVCCSNTVFRAWQAVWVAGCAAFTVPYFLLPPPLSRLQVSSSAGGSAKHK